MFSYSSTLSSSANANFSSTSMATPGIFGAVQSQSCEEKIPLTSKKEVERKLASILIQVQQNQIKRLDLTSPSLCRFYELAHTLSGCQSWVDHLAVLKNGTLVSGSGYPENAVKLWDLPSHSCFATLRGHTEPVETLAVLPNGQFASGSDDNTIKLWDLSSRSCISTLEGHTDTVLALTVFPNGRLASGSADKTIKLWDLDSGSCLSTLRGHTFTVLALAALPNGMLASGSYDRTIKLWDLTSGSCLYTLVGHILSVLALAILPNGNLASGSSDKTIKLWDLASHSCLTTLKGHTASVWALSVLPNGLLTSGSGDKTIKIWDWTSYSCLSTLRGHTDTVLTLAALPNGLLASGSGDHNIKLWESRTFPTKQLSPILSALKSNTSVTDFNLSGNRDILDDLIDPLIAIFTPDASSGLKPNTSLKTIDLRETGVSKKGVKKLEKAILRQRLSIEVLADCPLEWMVIYFLIIFCRANRTSPFADSGLELCKYGEIGLFLGIPSGFFARSRKSLTSFDAKCAPFPCGIC